MKNFLRALWFVWEAATAPFYPDPALKVEGARSWLENNVRVGDRLTPRLIKDMRAAEFKAGRAPADIQRDIIMSRPWSNLPIAHIYVCEMLVSSRPAISATDVRAWIALDVHNTIIHREIVELRVGL
ncbi:hypothetical protein [Sphingomonas mollis]|uniref:Uncharacterized protein n=1 Tax=Sphingomonas mollis TaxID=2795726 RepID=A0ABS0XR99_9SPHN|nr:hypothetical protein [Sphingomonas sp. BT553]MBJ6122577.1 hypothetical protein [Sphingomonas sp. BT553]